MFSTSLGATPSTPELQGRDKSLAREERLKPVQRQTTRWELEGGARADGHSDDDDERCQEADIGGNNEGEQQPRCARAHRALSWRLARRVANSAQNISPTVSS